MPSKKKKRAANPAVQLVSVSEPLPEPLAQCLLTVAGMALADANQLLGAGNWSEVCLNLEFGDDGSVGQMFQIDRAGDETVWHGLKSEGSSGTLLGLGELVAGLTRPWGHVDIRIQPDGACTIQGYASERPDNAASDSSTNASWGESPEYDALLDATTEARLAYFRTLGEPDSDVWFPLLNPVLRGGPAWPTRPAWQCIRAGKQTIVASSGLANPFREADGPNVGFGVEIAVATTDDAKDFSPAQLLETVQAVCFQAADDGRFDLRHEKFGVFLIGVRWVSDAFPGWLDADGTLGFLVGMPIPGVSTTISLPASTAKLLTAKLLSPAEYAYVAAHGESGARELIERFQRDGTYHLSSLRRAGYPC